MSDTAHLSHTHDPDTSKIAASLAEGREQVKAALLWLLAHERGDSEHGLAAFEATERYFRTASVRGWPLGIQPHSVPRRMSELHMAGLVHDTGARVMTVWNRPAVVWGLTDAGRALL